MYLSKVRSLFPGQALVTMAINKVSLFVGAVFVPILLMCDLPTDTDKFTSDDLVGTWKVFEIIESEEIFSDGIRSSASETIKDREFIFTFSDKTVTSYSLWLEECYDTCVFPYSISGNKLRGLNFEGDRPADSEHSEDRFWYTEFIKNGDQLTLFKTEANFEDGYMGIYKSTCFLTRYSGDLPPQNWPVKQCNFGTKIILFP
jgi:hypothetical protein